MRTLAVWTDPPFSSPSGGVVTSAESLMAGLAAYAPWDWRVTYAPSGTWWFRSLVANRSARSAVVRVGPPGISGLRAVAENLVGPVGRRLIGAGERIARTPAEILLAPHVFNTFTPIGPHPYVALTPNDFQHRRFPENFTPSELRRRIRLYEHAISRADLVIAGSRATHVDLLHFHPQAADKAWLWRFPAPADLRVPSDTEVILARRLLPRAAASHTIIYPAQLWPHKNHATLIRAVALLRSERRLEVSLVLTGAGPQLGPLQDLSRQLGAQDAVHFVGNVPRGVLFALLASTDLVAVPSLFEQASYPLVEAGWFQKPILAADIVSLREELAGHELALVPGEDPQAWADAIEQAFEDDARAGQLREAGRAVLARHDLAIQAGEFWRYMLQKLNDTRRAGLSYRR